MQTISHTNPNFQKIDFLIVTALPEERSAILRLLYRPQRISINNSLICYLCSLNTDQGNKVAVTMLPEMGNVEAAIHTGKLIAELKPSYVLMVGIAGGLKGIASLGDVIISTQVIYCGQAKQTPTGLEPRPISVQADPFLLSSAQNFIEENWRDLIYLKSPENRHTQVTEFGSPRVHFGPFAIVDGVVANNDYVEELKKLHSKLIGIEMESYGVARATLISPEKPGFISIRGVSDYADEDKDDGWRGFACESAAAFTAGFLQSGIIPLIRPTRLQRPQFEPARRSLISIRHLSMQHIPRNTVLTLLLKEFQGYDIIELPIDQTDLYKNGRLTEPTIAAQRQAEVDQKIDQLLKSYPDASLVYLGIAHIPLLFHLGYTLSNKRKLRFFEFNRYSGVWEGLTADFDKPELLLEGLPVQTSKEVGDVVIRISISNTISLEEIDQIVPSPISSLHLYIQPTERDAVVSERQLERYGSLFRKMLDQIHEFLPKRQRVHLFYAGPVSLAVYFGQLISQTIDRRILVYNYTSKDLPRYSWAYEITENIDSAKFFITTIDRRLN